MRRTLTVFTCTRCQKETPYEHVPGGSVNGQDWGEEWVLFWPAGVTSLRSMATAATPEHICIDCLTPDEAESLAVQRLEDGNQFVPAGDYPASTDDDIPF